LSLMAKRAGTDPQRRNVLRAELERLVEVEDGKLPEAPAGISQAAVAVRHGAQGRGRGLVGKHTRAGLDPAFRVAAGGAVAPVGLAGRLRLDSAENDRKNETRAAEHASALLLPRSTAKLPANRGRPKPIR